MSWSVDTPHLVDSSWEKASTSLCLCKTQTVSSLSLKVCCLYSFAGWGPKAYYIIFIVNKLSLFAPLNVGNYQSLQFFFCINDTDVQTTYL